MKNIFFNVNEEAVRQIQRGVDFIQIAETIRDADLFGRNEDEYRKKLKTAQYHFNLAFKAILNEKFSSRLLTAA